MTTAPTPPGTSLTPFLLLASGTLAAGIGNGIAIVALPWLVLERIGSATSAALVAAAASVPLLFASLISGTVVDLVGRRRISIVSDALSGLSVIAIPLIDLTFGLTVVTLAALAGLGSAFDPAGITARETMIPEAAARSGLGLDRANSIYEAIFNGAYLIGPGVGGVLIAVVGAVDTLWFTGLGFVVSMAAIGGVRLAGAGRPVDREQTGGFWRSTAEGLTFVWRERLLRTMTLLSMVVIGLYLPIEGVLLPVWFTERETPAQLGWVLMAMSIGGLLGALAYGQWGGRLRRRTIYVGSTILLGATVLGLALLPPIAVMLAISLVLGLSYGPLGPITNYVMQTRTPERLRGRVVGVVTSTTYAAGPAGFLLAGPLIDGLGIRPAFLLLAGAMMLVVLGTAFIPSLRQLDDPLSTLGAGDATDASGPPRADDHAGLPAGRIASLYPTMPLNHPVPTPESTETRRTDRQRSATDAH